MNAAIPGRKAITRLVARQPKVLAATMVLATSVAFAALFSTEAVSAQRYRAPPRSYDAAQSRPGGSRFTPEEQRIIDAITANGWNNGR
jgi:hypothetical protein